MTMNNYSNNIEQSIEQNELKENVLAGMVGAFLFSLVGGALWFVFYLFGFIAGISGLVGAICAIKGYSIFAKKESTKGIIISVVIALLVMVLAWYLCLGYDIYMAYQDWYSAGEIDYTLTFFESVQAAPIFLGDSEIGPAYLGDLGLGLLFCVVAGGSYVVNKIRNTKQKTVQNNFTVSEAPNLENNEVSNSTDDNSENE